MLSVTIIRSTRLIDQIVDIVDYIVKQSIVATLHYSIYQCIITDACVYTVYKCIYRLPCDLTPRDVMPA